MSKKLRIPGPDGEDSSGESDGGSGDGGSGELDWDFLFDFRAVAGQLEERDEIAEVQWYIHDPVPEFTITTLEHGLGASIPKRIKSFYLLTDGLSLTWSLRAGEDDEPDEEQGEQGEQCNPVPAAGVELFDFGTVFGPWLDELWPSDWPADGDTGEGTGQNKDDDYQDFLWSLRGFDRIPAPDACSPSPMTVMCVEEEYPTYDLFLYEPASRDTFLLEIDFRSYLQALLETRGTFGWQFLLLEEPAAAFAAHPEWEAHAQRAERRIAELFPDAEMSGRKT